MSVFTYDHATGVTTGWNGKEYVSIPSYMECCRGMLLSPVHIAHSHTDGEHRNDPHGMCEACFDESEVSTSFTVKDVYTIKGRGRIAAVDFDGYRGDKRIPKNGDTLYTAKGGFLTVSGVELAYSLDGAWRILGGLGLLVRGDAEIGAGDVLTLYRGRDIINL